MDPGYTPDLGETWRNSTATASISHLQLRVQFLLLKTQTWLKYIHGEISEIQAKRVSYGELGYFMFYGIYVITTLRDLFPLVSL